MSLFLKRPNAPALSYRKQEGSGPCILFIHGLHSDKNGTKAQYLEDFCIKKGLPFLAFDCRGHGESEGSFGQSTLSDWRKDTNDITFHLTQGPVLCVGSSMGGWLGLLSALDLPSRIKGFIGLASAPDFPSRLLLPQLNEEEKNSLRTDGLFLRKNPYGAPFPMTQKFISDSLQHEILTSPFRLPIPLTLIHGMADTDVPYTESLAIAETISSPSVQVLLRKDADHRLSHPEDLNLIGLMLEKMIQTL